MLRPQLATCLAVFLEPGLDLAEISRQERMGCIKRLRSQLQDRRDDLLRSQLDQAFLAPDRSAF